MPSRLQFEYINRRPPYRRLPAGDFGTPPKKELVGGLIRIRPSFSLKGPAEVSLHIFGNPEPPDPMIL